MPVVGIDVIKVMTESGWGYIVFLVDRFSKEIVGHHAGYQSRSSEWMQVLDMAVQAHFSGGVRGCEFNLMSDNGCQPTGDNVLCWRFIKRLPATITQKAMRTECIIRTVKKKLSGCMNGEVSTTCIVQCQPG